MRITVTSTGRGTLIVTRTDGSNGPGDKSIEVFPRGQYRGYRFRRLRRWADDGQEHELHAERRKQRDLA